MKVEEKMIESKSWQRADIQNHSCMVVGCMAWVVPHMKTTWQSDPTPSDNDAAVSYRLESVTPLSVSDSDFLFILYIRFKC